MLGTERHESRRIDNQLRGRSGRQGDPGESRFYLSLEDDLMRLFATGAINWVMGKALPDDVPLEAKMVSKAIERAQTTVEQKNGEIRKNVLKYDEVMNAQRKVIYALRDQILDEADLRDKILEEHLPEAVEALVGTYCVADYHEEWDIDGLHADVLTYWPSSLGKEQLAGVKSTDDLYELLVDDAITHYEKRESELGADVMRQVERQVMLKIIDTKWREHLYEMDYLQEGINLRAMGQKDPLTEWQREGYEMFGMMMKGIAQDLVKYVMHVQVNVQAPTAPAVGTDFSRTGRQRSPMPASEATSRASRTCSTRRPTTRAGGGMAAAARRVAAEGGPGRRADRRGRPARHDDAGREVRVGQDASQRTVPVRERQEVQALPRQGLRAARARLLRRARADAQAHRRRRVVPQGRRSCGPGVRCSRPRPRAPTSGTTPTRPSASPASSARSWTTSTRYERLVRELEDAETLHELAREEDDESARRPRSSRARSRSTSSCGASSGLIVPGENDPDHKRNAVRRRHHLRHQQRVRLRLPPRQHGHVALARRRSAATATRSSTRSTRSSSTRPARR